MFKKIFITIAVIILVGVTLTLINFYAISKQYYTQYGNIVKENAVINVNSYLDKIVNDMKRIVETHAYWTEAVDHLSKKNDNWLSNNASTYIIESKIYSIDYILIANEDLDFLQESGGELKKFMMQDENIIDTLSNNNRHTYVSKINGENAIILSTPFYDNDLENPTGLYVCVTFLNEKRMLELSNSLNRELKELAIIEQPKLMGGQNQNGDEITIMTEILDSGIYIKADFDNAKAEHMFQIQKNRLVCTTLIIASSVLVILGFLIWGIVKQLRKLIKNVYEISDGNYLEISMEEIWCLSEMSKLTLAINKMSAHIKFQMTTITRQRTELISTIINASKVNDEYTANHNAAVSVYAKILAEEINYERIEDVVTSSKLHDIGKIAIPSRILNKPGKLTDEEYEIVKRHPVAGYNIIKDIDYFTDIKMGVKYHHERWDGKGYPVGLKGNEIPPIAQIVAIADVYDALTTDRAYRKAMSHEEAENIIVTGSGKAFNPELVNAFLERKSDFKQQSESHLKNRNKTPDLSKHNISA